MPTRTNAVGVAAILLALGFAASIGWSVAGPFSRPRLARAAPMPPPQREMARAAGEVLRHLQEQEDIGGRALSPEFAELKLQWSRRRVLAVRESDPTPEEELAALRIHLAYAKGTRDRLEHIWWEGDGYRLPIECANYFVAEAELWLARAEGRAP